MIVDKEKLKREVPRHHHAPIGLFAAAAVAGLATLLVFAQAVELETTLLEKDIAQTQRVTKELILPVVERATAVDPDDPNALRFRLPVALALAGQVELFEQQAEAEQAQAEASASAATQNTASTVSSATVASSDDEDGSTNSENEDEAADEEDDEDSNTTFAGTWKMVLYDEQKYDVGEGVEVSFDTDICDQMSSLAGHTHASCAKTSKLKGKSTATDSLGNNKCPSACTIGTDDCALWNNRQKDDSFHVYIANYACL